jgi:membrane-associated protease RseP (regulator of RpoE activity)
LPSSPAIPRQRVWIHVVLFVATVVTTLLAGAQLAAQKPEEMLTMEGLLRGLAYAGPLLLILLTHEMAHYLAARRHGVEVSLPYFIPAPPVPFIIGTFGAFIRIRGPIRSRNALIDIGASGPIAGLCVAIPVLAIGLLLSEVKPLPDNALSLQEGDSLLYLIAKWTVFGDIPPGHDVQLHPAAFAGWLGLFVTCLNLIPVGQMDGGHIAYGLLGENARHVTQFIPFALAALGIVGWMGWLIWGALLLLLGVGHPPIENPQPLGRRRIWVSALAAVLLIATFVPMPLRVTGEPGPPPASAPPAGKKGLTAPAQPRPADPFPTSPV